MVTNESSNLPVQMSYKIDCDHDYFDHVWHPCCEDLAVWQRVVLVAFHIITGFIPLLVGYVISFCFNQASPAVTSNVATEFMPTFVQGQLGKPAGNTDTPASDLIDQEELSTHVAQPENQADAPIPVHPYSKIGQEAIEFARDQLKEYPGSASFISTMSNNELSSITKLEIASLVTLRQNAFDVLLTTVQEAGEDWANEAVKAAATTFMKLSYAVSCLALEELVLECVSTQKSRDEMSLLYMKDLLICSKAYHMCRVKALIDGKGKNQAAQHSDLEDFAHLFYQDGTEQHSWNILFNDYCDRVRLYISEDELMSSMHFLSVWTEKDNKDNKLFKLRYIPTTM